MSQPYAHHMNWAEYVTSKSEGLNQEKLAELCSVSQSTVSRWKSGKGSATVENVIDFSRAVGDSPIAALVQLGVIRPDEVGGIVEIQTPIDRLEAADLIRELGRRLGVPVRTEGRRAG